MHMYVFTSICSLALSPENTWKQLHPNSSGSIVPLVSGHFSTKRNQSSMKKCQDWHREWTTWAWNLFLKLKVRKWTKIMGRGAMLKIHGERVTGGKAWGLQTEEMGCKCQTIFTSLSSGRRKQTCHTFTPCLCKFKRRFLLKFCVAMTTPGSTWT